MPYFFSGRCSVVCGNAIVLFFVLATGLVWLGDSYSCWYAPAALAIHRTKCTVTPHSIGPKVRLFCSINDATANIKDKTTTDGALDYSDSLESLKFQILQLGAALDRGQSYNPTSGEYYSDKMKFAKSKIQSLIAKAPPLPTKLDAIDGEWELVLSTVPHGIFRSSPFFLAIQEAYAIAGQPEKAELFFKLHELQTCSWGASKIGRVAQLIDAKQERFVSEFDTSIFSLTVIPVLGWFKLLPTFGGRVITVSKVKLEDKGVLKLEVDYTTSSPVDGLQGLGEFVWDKKVPVGAIWKLLPWNKGRSATATLTLKYVDQQFRVVEDIDGELFVYARPVYHEP